MTTTSVAAQQPVLSGGTTIEEREDALSAGADELAGTGRGWATDARLLPAVAAATSSMGLTAILLGWFGAARSTLLEEQVPYLISGGLLGLALAIIGALLYFSHWMAVSVREARARELARRRDHAELMVALARLADTRGEGGSNGRTRGPRPGRPLRGASSGS